MAWNDNNQGPWGNGPSGPRRPRGSGPKSPEDLQRMLREKLKQFSFGSGGGGNFWKLFSLVALGALILWLGTGFYRVGEPERGLVTRFGEYNRMVERGLHYHLPYPFEDVHIINVSNIRTFRNDMLTSSRRDRSFRGEDITNMMLTGDENILNVRYSVQWFVKDPVAFFFHDPRPEETVKFAADSAVREIIAQRTMQDARTAGKAEIIREARSLLQKLLDEYSIGIEIVKINLEEVTPPESVNDAFRDVQRAIADKERIINQARAYMNSIVPVARGKAAQIIEAAEAEKQAAINTSLGETARFESILSEYTKAPEVTAKRLLIQTSESILARTNKMILSQGSGKSNSVLPYLPLDQLKPKKARVVTKSDVLEQAKQEVSEQAREQAMEKTQ